MKNFAFIMLAFIAFACAESEKEPEIVEEKKPLKERLMHTDRDYLLQPLEAVWDDLAEANMYDPRFEETKLAIDTGAVQGSVTVKTNNGDTMYVEVLLTGKNVNEKHQWFYDAKSGLFKSQHLFNGIIAGADESRSKQEYQFYFEEGNEMISSYTRKSYGKQPHPTTWTNAEFTTNELNFIWSRKQFAKAK